MELLSRKSTPTPHIISGLIDIWRFQTHDGIVQAFQIMDYGILPVVLTR
jgi:hypothetical protein